MSRLDPYEIGAAVFVGIRAVIVATAALGAGYLLVRLIWWAFQ